MVSADKYTKDTQTAKLYNKARFLVPHSIVSEVAGVLVLNLRGSTVPCI